MSDKKERLRRLDRLMAIRQTYVAAAEVRVHDAEHEVQLRREAAEQRDRQICQVREEIAWLDQASGATMQNRERYIFGLHVRARQARETLENARRTLEGRRLEWRETRREEKIIEKVQERRLLEWRHVVDAAEQKHVDELIITRHAWNLSHHEAERPTESAKDSGTKPRS